MATYNIKIISPANSRILVITLLTIFIGCILLFIPHGLNNFGLSILIIFLCLIIVYFLWQTFVTAKTEWTIDSNGISMTWIKQFVFTNKQDITFTWNEIDSISRRFNKYYFTLKITLTSGQRIKFYHDTLTIRDDYKEFIKTLNQSFNNIKATTNTSSGHNPEIKF